MPYEVNETKTYEKPASAVFDAALKAVAGLGGELVSQKPESGDLEVRFDKKILGKVLGDRTHLQAKVAAQGDGASSISIEIYPLDPVGRKLMFGARKGVTNTVMAWFIAHLEHHLAK